MEPEEAGDSLWTCDSLQCVSPWWMLQQKGGRIDAAGKENCWMWRDERVGRQTVAGHARWSESQSI